MKLFKKTKTESICCNTQVTQEEMQSAECKKQDKGVKILGSGCRKCEALEKATRTALEQLKLEWEVEHVSDFAQIASYGVMTTPALVINNKVVSQRKVLTVEEVKQLLINEQSHE